MSRVKISIVTIVLNDPIGLEVTLRSCLPLKNLMGDAYEHIVVDSSPEKHRELRDHSEFSYIKWMESSPQGIYPALNLGSRMATGRWLWHLNARDCLMNSDELFSILMSLEEESAEIIFSPVVLLRENSIIKKEIPDPIFKKNLIGQISLCHQGVLVSKDLFLRFNGFTETFRYLGDYDFWVRAYNSKILTQYINNFFAGYDAEGVSAQNAKGVVLEYFQILKQIHLNPREKICGYFKFSLMFIKYFILFPFLKTARIYKISKWAYRFIKS
ncbi:MAG: hypothetical protein J0L93_06920 [Deltaproteobacteria bacterium]|nr:hypothetical protein [Deltaproteobacteria bacterium]